MDDFLIEEWFVKKNASSILFYSNISTFFKNNFPQINLSENAIKDVLISELSESPNFYETHRIISKLSAYKEFTQKQLDEIVNALVVNTQVAWIIDDPDVYQFYKKIHSIDKTFFTASYEELDKALKWVEQKYINIQA